MLQRYTFWLTAAVLFQFLTAVTHLITFYFAPHPVNETEEQLNKLMTTYRQDLGAGFVRTPWDLLTALSACFPLLCLLGGLTLGYLLLKNVEPALMKGVIGINLAIFLVCLIVMIFFAFLPPVVFVGMIVLNLMIAYILCPNIESAI
jgi:hypothetical protein